MILLEVTLDTDSMSLLAKICRILEVLLYSRYTTQIIHRIIMIDY